MHSLFLFLLFLCIKNVLKAKSFKIQVMTPVTSMITPVKFMSNKFDLKDFAFGTAVYTLVFQRVKSIYVTFSI